MSQGRTEPGAGAGALAGCGGRGRPLPGAKPLEPSGPLAMRTPFGAPGACPCTAISQVSLIKGPEYTGMEYMYDETAHIYNCSSTVTFALSLVSGTQHLQISAIT